MGFRISSRTSVFHVSSFSCRKLKYFVFQSSPKKTMEKCGHLPAAFRFMALFLIIGMYFFLYRKSQDSGAVLSMSYANSHCNGSFRVPNSDRIFEKRQCNMQRHVAFIKTHKCASTAVQNILFRYGEKLNLTFGFPLPPQINYYTKPPYKFHSSQLVPLGAKRNSRFKDVDLLCFHSRAHFAQMSDALPYPDTKFITIIRDPVDMFESMYTFKGYSVYTGMNYTEFVESRTSMVVDEIRQNFFGISVTRPNGTVVKVMSRIIPYIWNPMLYEFGVEYSTLVQKSDEEIMNIIIFLDSHFDLVMISNRMEESLVLLRELLCCDWDDVIVLRKNERRDDQKTSDEDLNQIVREWNHGDQLLYDYFLGRLDRKIQKYGKDRMSEDVQKLRNRTESLKSACIKSTVVNSDLKDRRMREYSANVYTYELKEEEKNNKTCLQLVLPELMYRKRLIELYKHNLPARVKKLFNAKPKFIKASVPIQKKPEKTESQKVSIFRRANATIVGSPIVEKTNL